MKKNMVQMVFNLVFNRYESKVNHLFCHTLHYKILNKCRILPSILLFNFVL